MGTGLTVQGAGPVAAAAVCAGPVLWAARVALAGVSGDLLVLPSGPVTVTGVGEAGVNDGVDGGVVSPAGAGVASEGLAGCRFLPGDGVYVVAGQVVVFVPAGEQVAVTVVSSPLEPVDVTLQSAQLVADGLVEQAISRAGKAGEPSPLPLAHVWVPEGLQVSVAGRVLPATEAAFLLAAGVRRGVRHLVQGSVEG